MQSLCVYLQSPVSTCSPLCLPAVPDVYLQSPLVYLQSPNVYLQSSFSVSERRPAAEGE
jgi:hypothetical protein